MNEENRNRVITPREYSVLVERDEARTAKWLLFGILGILTAFVLWAFFAEMETLTRASGKVIPSSKVKIVQHFEGGIVYDIFAEEGELVDVGQPIITIDNTKAESEMESVELRYKYGRGQVARLQALIELAGGDLNAEPKFPIDLETDIVFQENIAFSSAKAEFEANIFEFEKKLDQRRQQKSSAYQELDLRRQQIALLDGTIQTYENLKGAGAVSRLDMDDKRSQLIETKLTVSALQSKLPILDSESKELQAQRKKYIEAFRYDAVQKLNEAKQDVYSSQALMRDRAGALSRTEILSPIAGIINQLYVTAPGEVIKPGGQVAEIVPIEDKFIAEVLIPPSEIGFLKIGQTAKIKV
ncbi:MAG: HlyD family type I secretion periplasmic adaptor subunit, partial [Alphaproteobacteria bacterium]